MMWIRCAQFSTAFLAAAALLAAAAPPTSPSASVPISYNRQIRPIFSENCFLCHGPDKGTRKANLRLDVRESALEKKAIVPGDPDASGVIKHIFSDRKDQLMPPPESHKSLTPAQKQLLKAWIQQGAEYQLHWAYIPPEKPSIPAKANPIDYLVGQRLEEVGLQPSPEADRRTIARRLYFDLSGLPPKPEQVAAFEQDKSPGAISNLVEQLITSPKFGERMAQGWLDVARFADTIGYHSDNPRNIWPYRDYVIQAFNSNKPFNQFTVEQLAGDLLPNASQEQKIASAFNRLLLTTEEGGAQPKDYEYRMLTDRVRAVGTVWLGQTLGCAACHDHKFDPTTMRDFYSLGAFFADIKEPIIGKREEGMAVADQVTQEKLTALESELQKLEAELDADHPELHEAFERWQEMYGPARENEKAWLPLPPSTVKSARGAELTIRSDTSIFSSGPAPDNDTYSIAFTNLPPALSRLAGFRIEALPDNSLPSKGPGRAGNGNFVVTEVVARLKLPNGREQPINFTSAAATFEQTFAGEESPYKKWPAAAVIDGDSKGKNWGWAVLPEVGRPQELRLVAANPPELAPGSVLIVDLLQNHGAGSHVLGRFRISATADTTLASQPPSPALPPAIADALKTRPADRSIDQRKALLAHYSSVASELAPLRKKIAEVSKARNDLEASLPRCLVTVSTPDRRTVRILPRGNFLQEATGELVEPALPSFLPGAKTSTPDKRLTRLDLAEWLVSRTNPLPARVTMNRLWRQFFGTGLSRVVDDLGAQGEPPPNPALLDWLACEFMDSGWDLRHMVRLITNSRTYRQSSIPGPDLRTRDPYNRELAFQSRWRLEAEQVRDTALAISGLLNDKLGGASFKPYQPDGYWENLNFPPRTYDASPAPDQYRRGVYAWWQRSYLHPGMLAFDAPTREECAAERTRSNIPQQALALLNDPTFVEASRAFAIRILREGGNAPETRLTWAWRQALARDPKPDELLPLQHLLDKHRADYSQNTGAADALLKVGLLPAPENIDKAELAAWTNVARVILNLHETITRS